MTSKPASLSAWATTLAPRSCPSRPGFAMRIVAIFMFSPPSENRDARLVLAEDVPQSLTDLAQRGVDFHRLQNRGHEIIRGFGLLLERGESLLHLFPLAIFLPFFQFLQLEPFAGLGHGFGVKRL